MVAPIHLQFAIAFHCSGDPIGTLGPVWDSEVGQDVRKWLVENELIASAHPGEFPRGTDKLMAWVEHLCSQPLPVCKWVVEAKE